MIPAPGSSIPPRVQTLALAGPVTDTAIPLVAAPPVAMAATGLVAVAMGDLPTIGTTTLGRPLHRARHRSTAPPWAI